MPEAYPFYSAVVDVSAPPNSFSFGFQLALQNHQVPIFATASGLHAETDIAFDPASDASERKIAVYFDGEGQNGIELTFKMTLTPLDSDQKPVPNAAAVSWSLKWTTSVDKPARLKGFVPLSACKPDSQSADGDKPKKDTN